MTRNYSAYVKEAAHGEAEDIHNVDELSRLVGELGSISDDLEAGDTRTPEIDRQADALADELVTVASAIEADEIAEVDAATAHAKASSQRTTLIAAVLFGVGLVITMLITGRTLSPAAQGDRQVSRCVHIRHPR